MKKLITVKAMKTDDGKVGTYNSKTIFEIGDEPTFDLTTTTRETLIQDIDNPIDITQFDFTLDFNRPNRVFYCRTKTFFTDGTNETEFPYSPISMITSNGGNSIYNHSNIIIKTPKVSLIGSDRSGDKNSLTFESEHMFLYSGEDNLTHVSYRILDEGEVIWDRMKDPEAKLKITLPKELEKGRSYTFEMAHHVGDNMSQWGKCYFKTEDGHSDLFKLEFEREPYGDYNVVDITNYNFVLLRSMRTDVIGVSWTINKNGVEVISSTTLPIDNMMPVRNNHIIIAGGFLTENEKYELDIEVKYTNVTSRNQYKIMAREGYDYSNIVGNLVELQTLVNLGDPLIEAQRTTFMMDDRERFGRIIDVSYGVVGKDVRKVFRVGDDLKKVPMASPINLFDLKYDRETRVDIIDNKAIVSYVREFADGISMKVMRSIKIYDYNPILKEIFNVNNPLSIDLDYSTYSEENMDLIHIGFNKIATVTYNLASGSYELTVIDLNTGLEITDESFIIGTGAEFGIFKRPNLGKVDKDYFIIVGELKTVLHDRRLKTITEIEHVDESYMTMREWTSLVQISDGTLRLFGINANVAGGEIMSVLKFNDSTARFELQYTGLLPLFNSTKDLRKPNMIVMDEGTVGVLFDEKSTWLLA